MTRTEALARIRGHITTHGFHVYVIPGGCLPRWVYTIGLIESLGFELILAGASYYTQSEALEIVNQVAQVLKGRGRIPAELELPDLGVFSLRKADDFWIAQLMLGAVDFYQGRPLKAMQICPDLSRTTVDVPDMTIAKAHNTEAPWKWLDDEWHYPVPKDSTAVTNLAALQGECVTEAVRWEENEWELFAGAGPDVMASDIRIVPLATLLAVDESLEAVVHLKPTEGLWRKIPERVWNEWKRVSG